MTYESDMQPYSEDAEKAWNEAGPRNTLEEGEYQAVVGISRMQQNDREGNWEWMLRLDDVEGSGSVTVWCNMEHEVGLSIAAGYCKVMGVPKEDFPLGLRLLCESGYFDDMLVAIKVKDNPKDTADGPKVFKKVYINKLLRTVNTPVDTTKSKSKSKAKATVADDDIPF